MFTNRQYLLNALHHSFHLTYTEVAASQRAPVVALRTISRDSGGREGMSSTTTQPDLADLQQQFHFPTIHRPAKDPLSS